MLLISKLSLGKFLKTIIVYEPNSKLTKAFIVCCFHSVLLLEFNFRPLRLLETKIRCLSFSLHPNYF
jgi:hypothetical protein